MCVSHTVNYTNICFIEAFKKDKHLEQIKDYIYIYIYIYMHDCSLHELNQGHFKFIYMFHFHL